MPSLTYLHSLSFINVLFQIIFFNKFFVAAAGNITAKTQKKLTENSTPAFSTEKKDNIFFEETRIE
jgi:hypothetical protein